MLSVWKRFSPHLVEAFVARLSAILSWDRTAAEEAIRIRTALSAKGTAVGGDDTMIAGHALRRTAC
jgi:tRNA(fMet)-specific endonuclease VapC